MVTDADRVSVNTWLTLVASTSLLEGVKVGEFDMTVSATAVV